MSPLSPLSRPGFGLPRVAEAEVRQRVQDPPAGPASDPGDGRRERAEGADGRAHAGDGGLASEHRHAAGAQLAGQQHRRHPPQEEEGEEAHKGRNTRVCAQVGGCHTRLQATLLPFSAATLKEYSTDFSIQNSKSGFGFFSDYIRFKLSNTEATQQKRYRYLEERFHNGRLEN